MQKKRELMSLIVIAVMVVITIILVLVKGGITGAEVGVAEEGLMDNYSEVDNSQLAVPPEEMNNLSLIIINESSGGLSNFTESFPDYALQTGELTVQDFAIANGSQCGAVTSSINLTNNILINGTCFILNTSHVVINGMGLNITGNTSGYGFNTTSGVQNITIKNFGGIGGFENGIYLNGIINLTIFNSTVYNNSYGVYYSDAVTKDINISSSIIRSNDEGIYLNFGADARVDINFNNISYNRMGLDVTGSFTTYEISNNNFYNNSYNLVRSNKNLTVTNNWWGFGDCVNVSKNISLLLSYIDFDPILNIPYPNGVSTECPNQYCGMTTFSSKTLTGNIGDCPSSIKYHMIIANSSVFFDCKGYTISTSPNGLTEAIRAPFSLINITNCRIIGFSSGILGAGSNASIINNTFINLTSIDNDGFTGLSVGTWSKIINNTFFLSNSSTTMGQAVLVSGINSTISGNNISNIQNAAFKVTNKFNYFDNNFVHNNTVGYWLRNSYNNFTVEKIINNSKGVLIDSDAAAYQTNTFKNSQFINNSWDASLEPSSDSNVTFINSSVDKNKINTDNGGTVYVRWYVDVNVTDNLGVPISINVTALTSLSEQEYFSPTDGSGLTRLEMTEFYRNSETNYYLTPGKIVASKENYTKANKTINLYGLTYAQVNLTITPVTCGSNITTDFTMGTNYQCAGNALTILTDNIIINGNGYNLTGNGTNIGINLNNRKNISISNLMIQNFTYGLYFQNTNFSNLTSLKVVNNSVGAYYENSYDNIFYDSNLGNNTNVSLYAINSDLLNLTTLNISLANSTVKDFNDLNASGWSNIFYQWYVDVNVTNNVTSLPDASIEVRFNNTGALDKSTTTGDNGAVRIRITELKKNSTGIGYLTPHTINLSYSFQSSNYTNSTQFNLTITNNWRVNLTINLNCTVPSSVSFTANTVYTFCPGTYTLSSTINVNKENVTINCVGTTLRGSTGQENPLLRVQNKDNVAINNCTFRNAKRGISTYASINTTIDNINDQSSGSIYCLFTNSSTITNSILAPTSLNEFNTLNYYGLEFYQCHNWIIGHNNTFSGPWGISLKNSHNNTFKNNTFSNTNKMIRFDPSVGTATLYSTNNTFYYNNFTGTGTYVQYETIANYTNYFNTSSGGYAQGNEYGDYCDKGLDLNSDGYADTDKAGADDWPYSENISSRISATGGSVIDYGPKITTCPASEVFLGSSGGSSSASTSAPASAPAAAPPPGFSTYQKPAEKPAEDFSTLEEIKKHLKSDEIIVKRTSEETMQVAIKLENTGDKKMKLFPGLDQDTEDPLYIVTKKTVGFEGSLFSKLAGISYSENTIAGRLLQAEIIGAEEIILNPGETLEKTLEIKDALIPPKQIKIKFSSFGETVSEQEIKVEPKKVISGTAIDIESEQDLIDVYAIMVPEKNGNSEESGENNQNSALTGAAVVSAKKESSLYYLEIKLTKKGSDKDAFVDWYGPYHTKPGQYFLFAQQFKYGQPFQGDYLLRTKIYRGGELVTDVEQEVKLE